MDTARHERAFGCDGWKTFAKFKRTGGQKL